MNSEQGYRIHRVALVTMDSLHREALGYTFSACERMEARLDILSNLPPEETNRAVSTERSASDTPWRFVPIRDTRGKDLFDYLRNEPGLLFLASDKADETAWKLRDRLVCARIGLRIPWVMVEREPPGRVASIHGAVTK